ncbi:MAG: hypothetical protein EBU92_13050 [Betaproteobacteria bacterium]|nr:hypothetical protein [Betaproteobacteria bacterium]
MTALYILVIAFVPERVMVTLAFCVRPAPPLPLRRDIAPVPDASIVPPLEVNEMAFEAYSPAPVYRIVPPFRVIFPFVVLPMPREETVVLLVFVPITATETEKNKKARQGKQPLRTSRAKLQKLGNQGLWTSKPPWISHIPFLMMFQPLSKKGQLRWELQRCK